MPAPPPAISNDALTQLEARMTTLLHVLMQKQDELRGDVSSLQSTVNAIAAASAVIPAGAANTTAATTTATSKDTSCASTPICTSSRSGVSTNGLRGVSEGDLSSEASARSHPESQPPESQDGGPSTAPTSALPTEPRRKRAPCLVEPTPPADSDASSPTKTAWALVENDADLVPMLRDVRVKITDHAERVQRRQPQVADLESEGTLYVQLLHAKGLLAADPDGFSDPYAKLSLGEQKQRSRTVRKTLHPVWHNEVFAFYGVLGQLM